MRYGTIERRLEKSCVTVKTPGKKSRKLSEMQVYILERFINNYGIIT